MEGRPQYSRVFWSSCNPYTWCIPREPEGMVDHSPLSLILEVYLNRPIGIPAAPRAIAGILPPGPCLLIGYSPFAGPGMAKEMDRTREEEEANPEAVCWQEAPLFPWETAQNGLACEVCGRASAPTSSEASLGVTSCLN